MTLPHVLLVLIGAMVGACLGVVLCALCVMAGRNDLDREGRR